MTTNLTRRIMLLLLASLAAGTSAPATDLADLATVIDRTSHRASSYDRTGGNDDNLTSFEPGRTVTLLDTDGPGLITHMWLTVSPFEGHSTLFRDLVIRMYWEGSKVPAVEVPLGDFFGLGHGRTYTVRSSPINVGADPRALNCYWPMPFRKHARIELTNVGTRSIRRLFYNIDYELGPIPPKQGLFHAEFRRTRDLRPQPLKANTTGKDNYVLLDAKGEGQYVGCFLFLDSAPGGWWGEGDDMIFVDGETTPSIIGTGTEDYFCEAWGFDGVTGFPFYGVPLLDKLADGWTQTTVYRLHVPDPVRFKKSIRVTIEHGRASKVVSDYSSVAYWYQLEPISARRPLPEGDDYRPRNHATGTPRGPSDFRWCATQAEAALRQAGISARAITTGHRETWRGGYLRVEAPNRPVSITIPVPTPGDYRVRANLLATDHGGPVTVSLRGEPPQTVHSMGARGTTIELGIAKVGRDATVVVTLESPASFAVECFMITRAKREKTE